MICPSSTPRSFMEFTANFVQRQRDTTLTSIMFLKLLAVVPAINIYVFRLFCLNSKKDMITLLGPSKEAVSPNPALFMQTSTPPRLLLIHSNIDSISSSFVTSHLIACSFPLAFDSMSSFSIYFFFQPKQVLFITVREINHIIKTPVGFFQQF